MEEIKFIVDDSSETRIDQYLASKLEDLSRSEIKNLIKQGQVLLNQKQVKPSYILRLGDEILLSVVQDQEEELRPENLDLDIIYQDSHLAVINKPSGMVVHPGAGNSTGTLVNAILYQLDSLGNSQDKIRPGIVHRLDKDTSGLMLVAKDDETYHSLVAMFKDKAVKREYRALVHGVLSGHGTVDEPIGRHPIKRQLMTVTNKNSRPAITHYESLERFDKYTYLKAQLETGRTHQIRVHMKYLNHPLVGDPVYSNGKNEFGLKKQFLHSSGLEFIHPISGEAMKFYSDLPEDLNTILENLKKRRDC